MSKEIVPVAFCALINLENGHREIHYVPFARFIQGIVEYEGGDPISRLYSDEDWDRFDVLIGSNMLTAQFRKSMLPEVSPGCKRKVYVKGVEDPKADLDADEYSSLEESVKAEQVSPYFESTIYGWFGQSLADSEQEIGEEKSEDKQAFDDFISGAPLRKGQLLMEFTMGELNLLFTSIEVGIDGSGTFVRLSDRLTKKKYKLRKEQAFCRSFASRIDYLEGMAKSMNATATIDFERKSRSR